MEASAEQIGFAVGVLLGIFLMYAMVHNMFTAYHKSYAKRSDYEKVLFWASVGGSMLFMFM